MSGFSVCYFVQYSGYVRFIVSGAGSASGSVKPGEAKRASQSREPHGAILTRCRGGFTWRKYVRFIATALLWTVAGPQGRASSEVGAGETMSRSSWTEASPCSRWTLGCYNPHNRSLRRAGGSGRPREARPFTPPCPGRPLAAPRSPCTTPGRDNHRPERSGPSDGFLGPRPSSDRDGPDVGDCVDVPGPPSVPRSDAPIRAKNDLICFLLSFPIFSMRSSSHAAVSSERAGSISGAGGISRAGLGGGGAMAGGKGPGWPGKGAGGGEGWGGRAARRRRSSASRLIRSSCEARRAAASDWRWRRMAAIDCCNSSWRRSNSAWPA
jgi:hypothetical protein